VDGVKAALHDSRAGERRTLGLSGISYRAITITPIEVVYVQGSWDIHVPENYNLGRCVDAIEHHSVVN